MFRLFLYSHSQAEPKKCYIQLTILYRERDLKRKIYNCNAKIYFNKNIIRVVVLYKALLIVYEYIMYQSNKTNFNMLFYYLGQHVSNLIESPSGPSMIQILHSYILEINMLCQECKHLGSHNEFQTLLSKDLCLRRA